MQNLFPYVFLFIFIAFTATSFRIDTGTLTEKNDIFYGVTLIIACVIVGYLAFVESPLMAGNSKIAIKQFWLFLFVTFNCGTIITINSIWKLRIRNNGW